ncbi:ADP-ribosyltransferase [Phytohabitans houttuyneae]|uniref:ADP ribosyltransferase domain-containing protein n=1 Tax=Phytohabitans houttuyneae TaxID=1076126 RepID=A0A6V8KBY3_9ACTN|nr:ADP-ribosyltransferase [Phytohabitans houttuyneae]GFJ79496.1 hypothetical protein Phou_036760 [Phytohabitans houttuyneae]
MTVARRKFNPTLHPRDKNGRFTRSGTRDLKKGDRTAAAAVMAGFKPKRGVAGAKAAGYLSGISGSSGPGQTSAVQRYLNEGGFVDVHQALRAGKGADNPDVAELDAAMIELPDDLLVSRRVPLAMFGDATPDQLVGMKVRDAAYSPVSLSTVPGKADDVRLRIAVPKGTPAIVAPDSGELVLDRDLEMAVTSVEKNTVGGWDMHLVVLPKDGARDGSGGRSPAGGERSDQTPEAEPPAADAMPEASPAPSGDDTDAALRAELMRLRVPELQRRARERGLKPGRARKSQLVDMIVADERGDDSGDTTPAPEAPAPAAPSRTTGPLVGDAARDAAPVSIARGRARGGLTRAERQALVDYRGSLYLSANGVLRQGAGQVPDSPEYRTLARRIEGTDAAIAKSPLTADVEVARGVKTGRAVFGDAWDGDLTGAEWVEHAYVSTSTSEKTAGQFADFGARGGAKMRIRVPAGTPGVELSGGGIGASSESEILLRRGLTMRVVSDSGPGENRELVVEVVPDGGADTVGRRRGAAGVGGSRGPGGAGQDDDGLPGGANPAAAGGDGDADTAGVTADEPTTAATAPAGGAVTGARSATPPTPNTWGQATGGNDPIHFHDDGEIGTAIKAMGDDALMDIDGEPLADILGRLATDAVLGRGTSQQTLDGIKAVRDRLPDGSQARRQLDLAIDRLDAPDSPAPELPDGTPDALRQLAADLHAVPLVRREPGPEEDALADLATQVAAGRLSGRRLADAIRRLRNRRHESVEGKFEIDRAVDRAVAALTAR